MKKMKPVSRLEPLLLPPAGPAAAAVAASAAITISMC